MKNQYGTLALALILGTALFGGTVHAQLLDAGINGSVSGSADSSSSGTGAGVDADMSADADVTTDSDEDASGTDSSVSSDTNVSGDANFNILRRTLPQGMENGDAPRASASDVSDAASLRAYAESSLRNDTRYDGIVMDDSGMRVMYRKDARFLGFIPSGMNVTVNVSSSGDVSVSYPWYSFLYATGETKADLEARIASEIEELATNNTASGSIAASGDEDSMNAAATVSASTSFDSQRWARVLERIQATLSAEAETTASANAS